MNPLVSIIMGSTSDWGVMEEAANFLNEMQIPFEVNALSAHRTPEKVESFSRMVQQRGIRVIIAGAGMAAHLPGVIAAYTTLPVIGVPIKSSLAGLDAMLSIIQMPPGIPVATVGINAARNAAILATQIIALSDTNIAQRLISFKESLKDKVILANEELKKINYPYKVD
ncbi:MAG TPA: 5-(carboxyamino)imidazole ribonucleotide mutase [Bacteroidales bacterium]|jgi:5-(carboxyamino)imidazole ribonucleotide mutase|nr:5-(carboxyamino)imidazole ribonucleotide mutase [Bacteroidales bacterium]